MHCSKVLCVYAFGKKEFRSQTHADIRETKVATVPPAQVARKCKRCKAKARGRAGKLVAANVAAAAAAS